MPRLSKNKRARGKYFKELWENGRRKNEEKRNEQIETTVVGDGGTVNCAADALSKNILNAFVCTNEPRVYDAVSQVPVSSSHATVRNAPCHYRMQIQQADNHPRPSILRKRAFPSQFSEAGPGPGSPTFPTEDENANQSHHMEKETQPAETIDIPIDTVRIQGRRIISVKSLHEGVQAAFQHGKTCLQGTISFQKEYKSALSTQLCYVCTCEYEIRIKTNSDSETLPVNDAFAWGAACAPVGYEAAVTLLTAIDVPSPSATFFQKRLKEARVVICNTAENEMRAAGLEEKRLAIEANQFAEVCDELYPAITVVVDGGWCKRSYGHGYNSNGGAAVIIGLATGKVLHMGTRQKTCRICSDAEKLHKRPQSHDCHKNWSGPSTAMESDILKVGFQESIGTHGLVYSRFIGDGDSSVHLTVKDTYPGMEVKKIECRNHIMKNFTKHLAELSKDKTLHRSERQFPGMGGYFTRIVKGINSAIKHHHQHAKIPNQWKELNEDILNTPYHVFGDHSKCKQYFCDVENRDPDESNVLAQVMIMELWAKLQTYIQRVASYASSLIESVTTNSAEQFMSIANKYMEGKRKNLCQSYLYNLRMHSAVLSYNCNSFWLSRMYKFTFAKTPSQLWNHRKRAVVSSQKDITSVSKPRYRLKLSFLKSGGDRHYGLSPLKPDMPEEELQLAIAQLKDRLQVDEAERDRIQAVTLLQADSDEWRRQRKTRVTGSIAGDIFKLGENTDNTGTLKAILGNRELRTYGVKYGKEMEQPATAAYEKKCQLVPGSVRRCGLFVSLENGIFAASPDGLVGNDGLIEIKSPSCIEHGTPMDWPSLKQNQPALKFENGMLQLKNNHKHYLQVVMQIFVTGRLWCDYVVFTRNDIHIERISRNDETSAVWERMKPKLELYWMQDLAPELVDSRMERGMPYFRCPPARLEGRKKRIVRDAKKKNK